MSKLETAMDTIIDVFKYYSSKEGDKFKLSRLELKNLLRGELNSYLQTSRDRTKVDEIMLDLDSNLDGTVSFEEFVSLVTQLTVHSSGFFQGYTPCYQVPRCGVGKI
ncbi:hypothetical protein GBF38_013816 [Nibea albiflora]|uniref:Uncharacterized protein n=1 Tax=Nibea albiflora TaxID=240163 RepID=A0ACB7F6H7_NIBAL|nr:hypothetical protein GBF38_013816 [Nibea albiflora]